MTKVKVKAIRRSPIRPSGKGYFVGTDGPGQARRLVAKTQVRIGVVSASALTTRLFAVAMAAHSQNSSLVHTQIHAAK